MKFKRVAESNLLTLAKTFRSLAVVGPRQSGKSTLVRECFKDLPYITLESITTLNHFRHDPEAFIEQYKSGCIIDEVQRVPEIFSYLQVEIDKSNKKGRFILTGSNNFTMMSSVTQTLAGRLVFQDLLPLSIEEINSGKNNLYKNKWENFIWRGGYPEPAQLKGNVHTWMDAYLRTYVERDIRQIKAVDNIAAFQRLIYLCAGRIGQQINAAALSSDLGVNATTIQIWLDLLQKNYVIYLLKPFYNNYRKRVVKAPKLYFCDTGLACMLLGIDKPDNLKHIHLSRGPLFENFIINEMLKNRFNKGKRNNLFYFRDSNGNEVDVIVDNGNELIAVEIKAGMTVASEFFRGLEYWKNLTGAKKGYLIYTGDEEQKYSNGNEVINWKRVSSL